MSYPNWTIRRRQREYIDFFRFDMGYEDVFVTEGGALLYACADNIGCAFMTASRVYDGTLDEWKTQVEESWFDAKEIVDLRSDEQTQADICWLDGLVRAPEDVAAEIIAWEYAFATRTKAESVDFGELQKLHDEATDTVCLSRAAFTYDLPIAS